MEDEASNAQHTAFRMLGVKNLRENGGKLERRCEWTSGLSFALQAPLGILRPDVDPRLHRSLSPTGGWEL
jgi:hypothetical protein